MRDAFLARFQPPPRTAQRTWAPTAAEQTPIADLLDIDLEYRQKAKSGKLPRIAPRFFNPTHEAWLPVLHTKRDNRHYTALYSNTARAHELGTFRELRIVGLERREEVAGRRAHLGKDLHRNLEDVAQLPAPFQSIDVEEQSA